MIKSTASADPVELQTSPSAFYLWEFPEKPVSVRLSLDVVERLEHDVLESFRAITARGSEVGGLLLGRSEPGDPRQTIIDNYELFPCDYTRGPLYLLSDEEKSALEETIRRKKSVPGQASAVVGFFRGNTRKDLALDDEDLELFREYFSRPEQVYLLVKPYAAKPSIGGIFIWEDSKVRAEASYIEFPFRRSELGKGQFAKSIVTDAPKPKEIPVEAAPVAQPAPEKKSGRAQVLPFSLRRDEEPPVPAPPLKKDERAPVVSLAPKSEVKPAPFQVEEPVKPAVDEPAKAEAKAAEPEIAVEEEKVEPKVEAKVEPKVEAKVESKVEPKIEDEEAKPIVKIGPKAEPEAKPKPTSEPKPEAPPVAAAAAKETAAPDPIFRYETLPATSPFRGKKLWALFGGLAMLAMAGATLYYLKTKPAAGYEATVDRGFQLKAERSNGQLLVSWNRQSDTIRKAQSAVLSISDGAKTEDVPLDLTQLRAGSIMYSPLSTDVSFRLEVKGSSAGKSSSESVHVSADQVPPPPANTSNPTDANKPAAQTNPAQPAQNQAPPAQAKPDAPEASRLEPNSATTPEAVKPSKPADPPKPFSLASRIRPSEPGDLPEAPSVDPNATAAVAIKPGVPGRLPAPPAPVAAPPQPPTGAPAQTLSNVKVGGKVVEPKLIRRVDAVYPPMARQARVGGVVRLQASIGKDGKVRKIEVLSGPPLLRQAAIDAVQKWVYSPSLLNGTPVDATTDVDVNFNLSGR